MTLLREASKMTDTMIASPYSGTQMPTFTWADLEAGLTTLAASPVQRDLARTFTSAACKNARWTSPGQLLLEILAAAWVVGDENFQAEEGSAN
jgi:hypothetical protein